MQKGPIYVHPEEYENRVVDFFTQALLKDSFCKPGELNRATPRPGG